MKYQSSALAVVCVAALAVGGCVLNEGAQYNGTVMPFGSVLVLGTKASAELKLVHESLCDTDYQCTHGFIQQHYDIDNPFFALILEQGASSPPPGTGNFYGALSALEADECLRWQNFGATGFATVALGADPACEVLETSIE